MAQSVKGLPHKHEELSSDPSLPPKSQVQWCISLEAVWVSGSLLISSSNQISELQIQWENVSQKVRCTAIHVNLHAHVYHTNNSGHISVPSEINLYYFNYWHTGPFCHPLTTWVQSVGPTRWKERTYSPKLSCDLHRCTIACTPALPWHMYMSM